MQDHNYSEIFTVSKKKYINMSQSIVSHRIIQRVDIAENGKHSLLIGGVSVLLWILVAITLYVLKTGRPIGTKTSRIVQEFDRNRLGEKRWKRRKMTEAVIISVISVLITVLVFVMDLNYVRLDFPMSAFPFIGTWIGYNVGEIVRMNKL